MGGVKTLWQWQLESFHRINLLAVKEVTMKSVVRVLVLITALGLLLGICGTNPSYAAYPDKMITYIVPFAAGGGTDRIARVLSTAAIDHFGQPWHVVNIEGASGIAGWKEVLNRPADGYTIYQGSSTPVLALLMEEKPPLQPSEMKICCYVAGFRSIVVSKPKAEWSTWEKFKAYAKANPGKLTMGGTESNLLGAAAMFDQAEININLVPYDSTGNAVADFLGGHVDCLVASASTLVPLIPEKAVAVVNTSDVALPANMKEFKGVPDATTLGYEGMFFPRFVGVHPDTPEEIVDAISQKMGSLLKDKIVLGFFKKLGEETNFVPKEKAQASYNKMVERLKKVIKLIK